MKLKRRGFTDKCFQFYTKIWVTIIAVGIGITIVSPFLNITDLTVINSIVEKTTEAMMVFIGFIVWKAKSENCRRYKDVNALSELEEDI